MKKNIYITDRQKKIIKEALEYKNLMPKNILSKSVDDMLVSKLLSKRITDAEECFSDNISSVDKKDVFSKLSKLLNVIRRHEENIRPQLEKICYNTLTEIFDIPEGVVDFECFLDNTIKPEKQFHIYPDTNEGYEYEDYDEVVSENTEIEKRRIIQALYIGASINIANAARKLYIDEIFELDEELPHLYSKMMKINDYLLLTTNIKIDDKNHNQGGFVTVTLGNDETMDKIHAEGICFPILLTESIRGFMEIFASHGLPDDISLARMVINKADVLEDEPFYMKIGPAMWKSVTDKIKGLDTKDIPYLFSKLVSQDADGFIKLMNNVFFNTKQGKQAMKELFQTSRHDMEYEKFSRDMEKKQDTKDIIEDEYFSPEELEY